MKKLIILIAICSFILAFKKHTDVFYKEAITASVEKSLPLLQYSSHTFLKNAAYCHSCHGQGLGGITFALAKENGYVVQDTIVKEALDSICKDWRWQNKMLAENDDPVAVVITGGYDNWALSANHYPANKTIELLTLNVMRRQKANGSWKSVAARPPLEYYSITATALSVRAIQNYLPAVYNDEVKNRLLSARNWLLQANAETNEEKVYRLLGLKWSGADEAPIAAQAKELLATQHEDGGWSQLASLSTDAYATGQALYALNQAGSLDAGSEPYQKGIAFLLQTQLPDGSWHVKSRSFPVVDFVESGFPHDKDQFISSAGSYWATMALILASGDQH